MGLDFRVENLGVGVLGFNRKKKKKERNNILLKLGFDFRVENLMWAFWKWLATIAKIDSYPKTGRNFEGIWC